MNMIIAAVPTPAGERRPAREWDGNGAVPQEAGRDFSLGDDKLVALDDLISHRQGVWIDGEIPINVGKPFGLETNVALSHPEPARRDGPTGRHRYREHLSGALWP